MSRMSDRPILTSEQMGDLAQLRFVANLLKTASNGMDRAFPTAQQEGIDAIDQLIAKALVATRNEISKYTIIKGGRK